jgi:cell division protein FtsB
VAGREPDQQGQEPERDRQDADRARRRGTGSSDARSSRSARRPQGTRHTRPRDDRPGRPGRPASAERPTERERPSRAVRAAATFGLSTTRRAAVFAIVVCALALSVAVPLRTYLSQRDEVEVTEERQAELRAQVDALEERKAQLDDPAQVEAEARRRLRYVMPGETPYMVELPGDSADQSGGNPEEEKVLDQSWYQLLWNAVSGE